MLKIKVNNKNEHTVEFANAAFATGKFDGEIFEWDCIEMKRGSFHAIKDNHSYRAEVVKADYVEKTFVINVNGNNYNLSVKDKFDELLHTLGFDANTSGKVNDIKAPMPGLVLDVKVAEGAVVKKGDAVLVLEAMKMENILKSPSDGIVKKIAVKKGMAVEKNQVLIYL